MIRSKSLWFACLLVIASIQLALTGCSGDDGQPGPQGPQGPAGTPGTASTATSLNFTIDSVTIASPPVVNFTVTNERGVGFTGLSDTDLRFNIAKLTPGSNGDPSNWQDYIVSGGTDMSAGQERLHSPPRGTDVWGELVDHNDGTYTYTFATDITNVSCPAPCTDADGTPLDLSYQPGLTHRLVIQQGNSSLPLANAVFDFVPSGGAVSTSREIVKTDNCNECHDKITAHGSRFETKFCVTCHNPGSWSDTDGTVDFRVMIHKIHRGSELPSVVAGGSYAIGSGSRRHDFSDIVYPQDIRNCTKCHDGSDTDTPQGDNWLIPSLAACGSCHDDIDFSKDGSGTPPVDPTGHTGGIVTDNSECITCHAEGRVAGSVAASHTVPGKAERGSFQYNILEVCGTAPDANPVCPPNTNVTLKFSVSDPTGATTHQYGNFYNVLSSGNDPEFNTGGGVARLFALIAWDTRDYTNEGGTVAPGQPDSIDLRVAGPVVDNTDGTFTMTATAPIPATAVGTGTVAIEGHPAADDGLGAFTVRVPVNSEVKYFAITDTTPVPRRQIVDVPTKCDRCHDVLNVHGNNRNENGQLCVMCHNPSDSDVNRRPKDAVTGLPDANATLDGKTEESIDFKRMIHAIHAASASNFDGTQAHGFRTKGIVIYGFGGSENDFSHVRFPGVLSKCETCHLPDTYTLADRSADGGANWSQPAINGIKGSSVNTFPNAAPDGSDFAAQLADQTEDYKYSPIASVCSACHDSDLSMAHMTQNGAILGGAGSEQLAQEGNIEGCPVCHGPGKITDVKLVHDQAFADFLGEIIPE